jgi:hypothetical protein
VCSVYFPTKHLVNRRVSRTGCATNWLCHVKASLRLILARSLIVTCIVDVVNICSNDTGH